MGKVHKMKWFKFLDHSVAKELCGIDSRSVTWKKKKVTCKLCLAKMKKEKSK